MDSLTAIAESPPSAVLIMAIRWIWHPGNSSRQSAIVLACLIAYAIASSWPNFPGKKCIDALAKLQKTRQKIRRPNKKLQDKIASNVDFNLVLRLNASHSKTDSSKELRKIGRSETSDRVPSLSCVEAVRVTARIAAYSCHASAIMRKRQCRHKKNLPVVISFNAALPWLEYKNGLRKPIVGLPAAISLSFNKAMMDAKTGEDAEVPLTASAIPPTIISKEEPCAATSGYARPAGS